MPKDVKMPQSSVEQKQYNKKIFVWILQKTDHNSPIFDEYQTRSA